MITLAKSSTPVSLTAPPGRSAQQDGHYFTTNEVGFSQGWPSIDFGSNRDYMECMGFDFTKLSLTQQACLSGNGMHMASISAWLLYVYSNVVRKDVLQRIELPLGPGCGVPDYESGEVIVIEISDSLPPLADQAEENNAIDPSESVADQAVENNAIVPFASESVPPMSVDAPGLPLPVADSAAASDFDFVGHSHGNSQDGQCDN